MAYDKELADRIRELLAGEAGITESNMFGGLAFLLNGHMAITASGKGGILVRCDPARAASLVERGPAELAIMRGRSMSGWVRISSEHIRSKRELRRWANVALAYTRSLPAKVYEPTPSSTTCSAV